MAFLIIGAILIAVSWFAAWTQYLPFSNYYFPPLWIGYILFVNGLCQYFYRDSLIQRMGWWFLLLFIFSVPLWWFFEYLNDIVENWHYRIPENWSPARQFAMKALSFSTVIPAVYATAFLTNQFFKRPRSPGPIALPERSPVFLIALGFLFFALIFWRPDIFFPLVWLAPLLVLDPVNYHIGFPSVLGEVSRGKWDIVIAFALGTVITGFFWEMWNFYAFPKWIYTIPYVDFLRIFEMPILGYGGYLFFGLFVFTFTSMALGIAARFWPRIPVRLFE